MKNDEIDDSKRINQASAGSESADLSRRVVMGVSEEWSRLTNHALAAQHVVENQGKLSIGVHPVPEEIDQLVAKRKLDLMGLRIDTLTPEQEHYLSTWLEGT